MYQSTCTVCHKDGEQDESRTGESSCRMEGGGTYTGETSRSLYERVKEHLKNAKDLEKDSHIVKHWFLEHPQLQTQPQFKFKIIGKFKDCLSRQISEAVRLSLRPGSLNSKGEYGRCTIPRLVIQEDEYERKRNERNAALEEIDANKKWEAFLNDRASVVEVAADQVNGLEEEHGLHGAGDLRRRRLLTKRTAPSPPEDALDQPGSKKRRINIRDRPCTGGEAQTKTEKAAKQNEYALCDPMTYLEECNWIFRDLDDTGGTDQFVNDENRNLTKHPIVGRIERKKSKWGKKGENVQFREYFQNLAKTTHFSSVNVRGGGLKID
jgi:hypothetical protein